MLIRAETEWEAARRFLWSKVDVDVGRRNTPPRSWSWAVEAAANQPGVVRFYQRLTIPPRVRFCIT